MHAAVGDDKEWSEYLMPKPSDSTSSSMWHVLGPVIDHDKIISNKYRSICGNASWKEFSARIYHSSRSYCLWFVDGGYYSLFRFIELDV